MKARQKKRSPYDNSPTIINWPAVHCAIELSTSICRNLGNAQIATRLVCTLLRAILCRDWPTSLVITTLSLPLYRLSRTLPTQSVEVPQPARACSSLSIAFAGSFRYCRGAGDIYSHGLDQDPQNARDIVRAMHQEDGLRVERCGQRKRAQLCCMLMQGDSPLVVCHKGRQGMNALYTAFQLILLQSTCICGWKVVLGQESAPLRCWACIVNCRMQDIRQDNFDARRQ